MTQEHTKEPWRIEPYTNSKYSTKRAVMAGSSFPIAFIAGDPRGAAENAANALRIVTCVNALAGIPTAEVEGFVQRAKGGWRPIESAPRDKEFLAIKAITRSKAGQLIGGDIHITRFVKQETGFDAGKEILIKRNGDVFLGATHFQYITPPSE